MITLAGDIGGTRIKLAVVRNGALLARRVEDARSELNWDERLPALAEAWRRPRSDLTMPPLRDRLAAATQAGWAATGAPLTTSP